MALDNYFLAYQGILDAEHTDTPANEGVIAVYDPTTKKMMRTTRASLVLGASFPSTPDTPDVPSTGGVQVKIFDSATEGGVYAPSSTYGLHLIDAGASNVSVTLPNPVESAGRTMTFKRTDNSSNSIFVSAIVDGTVSLVSQNDWVTVTSAGATGWFITGLYINSETAGDGSGIGQMIISTTFTIG